MRKSIGVLSAALLLAVLVACGGDGGDGDGGTAGGNGAGNDTPVATGQLDIVEFNFKPQTVTVKAGDTVTWTNQDTFAHTVKADLFGESPRLDKGGKFSHTFARPGTYPYICGIHNSMTGTVVVQ